MFGGAPLIKGPGNGAEIRYNVFAFLLFLFFVFLNIIQRNTYVWPTYHKAVLRWGRASIALYINIMCGCSDRLYERNFRLADIYPSEVVLCLVRFNVEVLQPTFFSGSDYATGSCLCNSF